MRSRTLGMVVVILLTLPVLAAAGQEASPVASPEAMDSSIDDHGPVAVVGQVGSASGLAIQDEFPEPSVVLIDSSDVLDGEISEFGSESSQILGRMTTPLFPMPGEFQVDLPVRPSGEPVDLDFDGDPDTGVQVFSLIVASNLTGDSYLQQLEQFGGLSSVLSDQRTGRLTEGSLLLYAEDEDQGFPSHFGEDGLWFTNDDEIRLIPQGYSLATLSADGMATVDVSPVLTMNTLEASEAASPDFSDQGILESYNSLIDLLIERYAYTELRGLDWEEIRAADLPEVKQAEANQDFATYYFTLQEMARSLRDAHVDVGTTNSDLVFAENPAFEQFAAGIGATAIAISEPDSPSSPPGDTFIVLTVGSDSPAADAGWVPGTTIVSINGEAPAERFGLLPLESSAGTEEAARLQQMPYLLRFAEGEEVTFEFMLPDSTDVESITMEAGSFDMGEVFPEFVAVPLPISLKTMDGHLILQWSDFVTAVQTKIAVLEEALANQVQSGSGLILDLRNNAGGWAELYEVMASYFFTAEEPLPTGLFDWYRYDATEGDLVLQYSPDFELSAPRPEIAYSGPMVILIDEYCVSACEYFTQTLQELGKATVVGQYGTRGGGGNIDIVNLPGEIIMQYTVGRSTYAGTDEFNIEARGIDPDLRVPVTLDTELSKQSGGDPVLEAGINALSEELDALYEEQAEEAIATATAMAEAEGSPAAGATPEVDS